MLIPNTRVKFLSALIPGILCGTVFQVVQWLMLSGQIYVSKYNAIYGSFAFLPLLLIWIQLSWLICLSGVVMTYSSQSIFRFGFRDEIKSISQEYYERVTLIALALIVKRFCNAKAPLTKAELSNGSDIPIRLAGKVIDRLVNVELLSVVVGKEEREFAYQPSFDIERMTIAMVVERLRTSGSQWFIRDFDNRFASAHRMLSEKLELPISPDILIKDIALESNADNKSERNS